MNIFLDEHVRLLQIFNEFGVKYLLIGGYAVVYYGYERSTGDMDLWIEPNNQNRDRLIAALLSDGFEIEELSKVDFSKHFAFSFGEIPNKVEFLTMIDQVQFYEAYDERQIYELDAGVKIPIINLRHLILSKMMTGRAKDQADIEELQKRNKLE